MCKKKGGNSKNWRIVNGNTLTPFKLGFNLDGETKIEQIRTKRVKISHFKVKGPKLHHSQTSGAAMGFIVLFSK